MISISLFYCCEELFTHINTCLIEKNSMKLHYLKRGIAVTWVWNILLVRVACAGVGWGLWGGDLGEYCDLCVHGGVLLRGGVVGGFRGIWLGVWELGSAHFLAAPGLAWRAGLGWGCMYLVILICYWWAVSKGEGYPSKVYPAGKLQ